MTSQQEEILRLAKCGLPAGKLIPLLALIDHDSKTPLLPISIFHDLSPFEAVVKYLRDRFSLTYEQLGKLLCRSPQSVATSYHHAQKKHPGPLPEGLLHIPLSIVCQRRTSTLEAVVAHLKEKGLSFAEIARMLRRDQRTIWTIYRRWQTP